MSASDLKAPKVLHVSGLGRSRSASESALNVLGFTNITWHPPHLKNGVAYQEKSERCTRMRQ